MGIKFVEPRAGTSSNAYWRSGRRRKDFKAAARRSFEWWDWYAKSDFGCNAQTILRMHFYLYFVEHGIVAVLTPCGNISLLEDPCYIWENFRNLNFDLEWFRLRYVVHKKRW